MNLRTSPFEVRLSHLDKIQQKKDELVKLLKDCHAEAKNTTDDEPKVEVEATVIIEQY